MEYFIWLSRQKCGNVSLSPYLWSEPKREHHEKEEDGPEGRHGHLGQGFRVHLERQTRAWGRHKVNQNVWVRTLVNIECQTGACGRQKVMYNCEYRILVSLERQTRAWGRHQVFVFVYRVLVCRCIVHIFIQIQTWLIIIIRFYQHS